MQKINFLRVFECVNTSSDVFERIKKKGDFSCKNFYSSFDRNAHDRVNWNSCTPLPTVVDEAFDCCVRRISAFFGSDF